jgi:hypothetical protein
MAPKAGGKGALATCKAAICTKFAFFVSTRPTEVDRTTLYREF